LFAVLAHETGQIDEQLLVEACAVWMAHKQGSLVELPVDRNWITSDQRSSLEKLLEQRLPA
jgi:hypothetical protein